MTQSITTKAQLKRLPAGHRLTLINSLMGPTNIPRVIHEVKSNQIVMKLDDGRTSHLYLDNGDKLEPTSDGFLLRCKESGDIAVQYVVD
jgi:hypothetical protein